MAEALLRRNNALNLIRLLLATAVIVGHSWPLGGFGPHPTIDGVPVGEWAVGGFFCLSGFLIARSRTRLSFVEYLWHRFLRILPGFWCCLLVIALVLAPVSTLLSGETYSLSSALSYAAHNAGLGIFQRGIEATLTAVPYPIAWNGSLWTLSYEFVAYIAAGVALTSWLRKHPAIVALALFAGVTVVTPWADAHVSTQFFLRGLQLGSFFLAGMVLFGVSERLPIGWSWAGAAGALLVTTRVLDWDWVTPLPIAYLLLFAGAVIPLAWSPKSDISYGVYIYAFPAQQLLSVAGVQDHGLLVYMVAAVVLTVPVAWASWHWVEKPALRLKGVAGARRKPKPG